MRVSGTSQGLTVQAVAGSHVVLIGWNLPQNKCNNLAGFAIHRTDHVEEEAGWLKGMKTFKDTDPGLPLGTLHSTRHQPIQSFYWSDYNAEPGRDYTYRIVALKGEPDDLEVSSQVKVKVKTEAPEDGLNDVHFNRGIAASQQFARRFSNLKPEDIGKPAWDWLSRGLYEAMVAFVDAAKSGDKLLVCAYEFHFLPFLRTLKAAVKRGVDVKIIYDAKANVDKETGRAFPRDANRDAVAKVGLKSHCIERSEFKSAISHNKFMVRFKKKKPVSVWTGGTNFSDGGIFGQSNVGRVAEHEDIAQSYADYWEMLAKDPTGRELRPLVEALTQKPTAKPPRGTTPLFSPRASLDVLHWYAEQAKQAKQSLFMTFAFGMNDVFKDVYRDAKAPLRFALMEKSIRGMAKGPKRDAELKAIKDLRFMDENLFAIGGHFRGNKFDTWLSERLTGLNTHVRYVHNKFMMLDPLSDDPIIIGGSANFSPASTQKNDENMLITRGNKRVADIYLGEFMRLYSHHAFREYANRRGTTQLKHLRTGDWWKDYFGSGTRSRRRAFFAGVPFKP